MTLIDKGGPAGERIVKRLRLLPQDDIGTTIISYEEQSRGWLARLARLSDIDQHVAAYGELKRLLNAYCKTAVIAFDRAAADRFRAMRKLRIRIGTMDLKIA